MDNMVKTLCIVQARLTSTRLPNKVLIKLGQSNKTVLEHVYERFLQSKKIDKVVFAIPNTELNNPLEDFLKRKTIPYFRGDENNVMSRFFECAKLYKPEYLVRATCDNPCVDWIMADNMIEYIDKTHLDYVMYDNAPIGSGVEVFTYKSFEEVQRIASSEPEFEHVTYCYELHPDLFKTGLYKYNKDLPEHYRLTMDEDLDNTFMQKVYNELYNGSPFTNELLYEYLKENHHLLNINKNVIQKTV